MLASEVIDLQYKIMQMADVIACAITRRQKPADDLVTKNALYEEFGRSWVDKRLAPRGPINGKRMGAAKNSPIKFSRTEVVALFEAERQFEANVKSRRKNI